MKNASNTYKLDNSIVHQQWAKGEISKHYKCNVNEITTCQNLRHVAKAVRKGKVTAVDAYVKNEESMDLVQ